MLSEMAESFAEVVMQRFAPTEQRFRIHETRDAQTLYQRFAFLRSLITGDTFENALQQILSKPHRQWIEEEEYRRPGQCIPATSTVARQLVKPGLRIRWAQSTAPLNIDSLPFQLKISRKEETLDTPENRFVKFSLSLWRSVVAEIGIILKRERTSITIRRGLREVQEVKDRLDTFLSRELFRAVGRLTFFPAGSQVLQKREGYRDLFRTYIQFEAAALLAWSGGEDVYGAGQRDVATLYEYWVFFRLANVISRLCNQPFKWEKLIDVSDDGLTIRLRRGQKRVLSGVVSRLGRRLRVELWFNRTFGARSDPPLSWTRPMRPDCSLLIRPDEESSSHFEEVWLHFDAKYRVETLESLFGRKGLSEEDEEGVLEDEQTEETQGRAKRSDLLKMHAYHDAIYRSAGAFVIYPGSEEPEELPQYEEIIPGIGAFPLRPTETGEAEGTFLLTRFIDAALDHVALQVSQHERWRYWTKETYKEEYRVDERPHAVPFLSKPPADTLVLLGYVKSRKQLQWVRECTRYNLRADERRGRVGLRSAELAAELILLYGRDLEAAELWRVTGEPEIINRTKMLELAYPDPTGELYYCIPIEEIVLEDSSLQVTRERIDEVRARVAPKARPGAPVVTTWLEIVR
jgi:hypothetical protein